MICLSGPSQFRVVQLSQAADVRVPDAGDDLLEDLERLPAGEPLRAAAEQVLGGDHVQDRAHVLGHAAVDQDQAPGQGLGERAAVLRGWCRRIGDRRLIEQAVVREQAAPAHAPLGIGVGRRDTLDQLDAGEDPARILPAAPGTAEPLAEDRPGDDHLGLLQLERAGQVASLPGRPHQEGDQRGQQVGRDGQARSLGDIVDLADDLQAVPGTDDPRQQVFEPDLRALQGRRDQAGGHDAGLDQAEVVVAEVEQLFEAVDILARLQVDAGQPQDRLGDDPEAALDRGARRRRRGRGPRG